MTTHELLAEVEQAMAGATPGPWHPGCITNDDQACNCRSICDEGYASGIAHIVLGNNLPLHEGGVDGPDFAEAKANCAYIALINPANMRIILDALTYEREAREKAEAERDAALSDETFEAKYRAAYNHSLNKPGYWEDLARILSHRLREMDKRSRAANRRADAAEARRKEAEAVIAPFVTDWADEHGWTENACQNDRVVDWFGPSDFRAAAKFMEAKDGNQ